MTKKSSDNIESVVVLILTASCAHEGKRTGLLFPLAEGSKLALEFTSWSPTMIAGAVPTKLFAWVDVVYAHLSRLEAINPGRAISCGSDLMPPDKKLMELTRL